LDLITRFNATAGFWPRRVIFWHRCQAARSDATQINR
jgi:hypothetical protein